jgi:hypothetical protein
VTDLAKTIAPKSDQLNADDLIAGPMTITITGVRGVDDADQPIAVNFEGDGGKPFKPCKSMRRVMVHCWGADGKAYAGRRATLYCDQNVQFGGIKVGGIRISHLSHIDREITMALTVTRAKRSPYTVRPLQAETRALADRRDAPSMPASTLTLEQRADAYEKRLREAANATKLASTHKAAAQLLADLDAADPERKVELDQLYDERLADLGDSDGETA